MPAESTWWPEERQVWAPPEDLTPSQWAEQRRVMVRPYARRTGPFDMGVTPYLREIQDSLLDPSVRQITLKKSTQVGGSEALYNMIGWSMDVLAASNLLVVPRDDDVKEMSKKVREHVLESCESINGMRSGAKNDWLVKSMRLTNGAWLRVVGARSPSDLAAFAHRFVFGDEAGKWGRPATGEAPPFQLAVERTRTYQDQARVVLVSTPTYTGNLISQEHERGDKRTFWLPCPHCETFAPLEWAQIRFHDVTDPDEMEALRCATYHCKHCDGEITDEQKLEILPLGVWVPEGGRIEDGIAVRDGVPSAHRSYHLWAGYSPWLAWWQIAHRFLEWKNDPETLRNFVNSWLGEDFDHREDESKESDLRACVGDYDRDEVVPQVRVITAGVDVQDDRIYYAIRGWGVGERSWLIRAGYVLQWPELVRLLFRGGWGPDRKRVHMAFIDSQHRIDEVLEVCRMFPRQARAIVGGRATMEMDFTVIKQERHPVTGAPFRHGIQRWRVNVNRFKTKLHQHITTGIRDGEPRAFHVHRGTTDEYFRQMASEHLVREPYGRERTILAFWKPKPGVQDNHLWDCETYAIAAAQACYVNRLQELEDGPGRSIEEAEQPKPEEVEWKD